MHDCTGKYMFYGISEQYGDGVIKYRFNILLDLSDDQNYPLHAKTKSFCLTFVLVIANPIIFG